MHWLRLSKYGDLSMKLHERTWLLSKERVKAAALKCSKTDSALSNIKSQHASAHQLHVYKPSGRFTPGLYCSLKAFVRPGRLEQWQESQKGHRRFTDILLCRKKNGLTALVALDHNVFDGQQATLPWRYDFKYNLRIKRQTHNSVMNARH